MDSHTCSITHFQEQGTYHHLFFCLPAYLTLCLPSHQPMYHNAFWCIRRIMDYAVLFTTSRCHVRSLSSDSMPCHSLASTEKLTSDQPHYPHVGFPFFDFLSFITPLCFSLPPLSLPSSSTCPCPLSLPSPYIHPASHLFNVTRCVCASATTPLEASRTPWGARTCTNWSA